MPSASRFSSLRHTVRNHPVVVASSAASVGVLLGAFVAVQLLATPQPRADSAAAPQAGIASKPQAAVASKMEVKPAEAKPAPETTGSAPASDRTASVDCERETWPHLSRPCMEEMQSKHRTRVISTDKLDKSTVAAIEATSPTRPESKPAAPAVADAKPVSPSPSPSLSPVGLAAAPSAVFAAPDPSPTALTSTASQPAADTEAKKEKRVATKSKRKPKAPAIQESDDDDTSVASNASDDRVSDERTRRRDDRSDRRIDRRRIVERWTEREYDVPASNGDGRRRVTVIQRGGGGLFESLFGN
jgi:hypothetical protein